MAGITREHEGAYYYASVYNYPPQLHEFIKNIRHERSRGSVTGRALLDGKTIHVPDVKRDAEYTMRDFAQKAGFRTALGVPLLRDGIAIGVIVLTRSQVRPFSEKQIELVRTFAAQSVIAIENARLLSELRQSLDQQTATADVLRVISSSPGELEPVFRTILENAVLLCEATHGHVWRFDGELLHAVAVRGDLYFVEWLRQHNSIRPIAGSAADRIVQGMAFDHMADRRKEDAYRDNQTFREFVDKSGIRASLAVALRKDETLAIRARYFPKTGVYFSGSGLRTPAPCGPPRGRRVDHQAPPAPHRAAVPASVSERFSPNAPAR
jgi:hypothetical protein